MPKERSVNPAQAQRKADKAKEIKKGKAQAQASRNEKLARRNPSHIEKQLSDLRAISSSGGSLTTHEKSLLTSLEADLKAVKKAREALGDRAPALSSRGGHSGRGDRGDSRGGRDERGGRGGGHGVLGKRRRDSESEGDSDVPEDVRRIPMPRDTPPPFPKEVLDRWYQARRDRWARDHPDIASDAGTNANSTPLARNDRSTSFQERRQHNQEEGDRSELPKKKIEARTVYESAPVVRDLRKEAVAFVPAVVRKKLEKGKGAGGLLEPEEADRLEREGYMTTGLGLGETVKSNSRKTVEMEEVEDEDG